VILPDITFKVKCIICFEVDNATPVLNENLAYKCIL